MGVVGIQRTRDATRRSAGIVVDTHVEAAGFDALEIPIEDVLEIVEVIVLRTDGIVVGEGNGEAKVPAIVVAHGGSEIAIVLIEYSLEVAGTNANVDVGIIAIAAVRGALFGGDLHDADFGRTTGYRGVTSRFLKGDRSEEDGGDTSLGGHALKRGEVWSAGGKGAAIVLEDGCQVLVDEVIQSDRGWYPAIAVDAAVEPVWEWMVSTGIEQICVLTHSHRHWVLQLQMGQLRTC